MWQIKAVAESTWHKVPKFMHDTQKQTQAANADIGILVIVRAGHASPGDWWAHVWMDDLYTLVASQPPPAGHTLRFGVRLELRELVPLLRMAGYGTPPRAEATA